MVYSGLSTDSELDIIQVLFVDELYITFWKRINTVRTPLSYVLIMGVLNKY